MDNDPFRLYYALSFGIGDRHLFSTFGGRYQTYRDFPIVSVYPTRLAQCGFYFTGRHDEVKCFNCNLTYSAWKEKDNPFKVHFQWSPNCSFLLENYYNIVIRHPFRKSEIRNTVLPSRSFEYTELESTSVQQLYCTGSTINMADDQPTGQTLHNQEQHETEILYQRTPLSEMMAAKGTGEPRVEALRDGNDQPLSNTRIQRSKGRQLAKNTKCNRCWVSDSSIVFMPCCHLVSCQQCAGPLKYCFLCKKGIENKIEIKRG